MKTIEERRAYCREYHYKNRDAILARKREKLKNDEEYRAEILEKKRKYYQKSKEIINAKRRERYHKNLERERARRKKHREENKDLAKDRDRKLKAHYGEFWQVVRANIELKGAIYDKNNKKDNKN